MTTPANTHQDSEPQPRSNSSLWQAIILIGIIVALLTFAVPWGKLVRPSKTAVRESLKAAAQDYATLRINDQWEALYDMVAPAHRRKVDKGSFLKFYGHGMIDTVAMELTFLDYTEGLELGKTKFTLNSKVRPEKLPPSQRRSLQYDKPEDLEQEGNLELTWERHGGNWYFHLDGEVVSGQSNGESIRGAFDPAPDQPRRTDPTQLQNPPR